MGTPSTVAFHTLGCKLNFAESSTLARQLEKNGVSVVDINDQPQLFVLNTCSVTDFADKKCRKIIRKVLRHNPTTKVIVTGCYAQLRPEEIANIPGVDLVLGAGEKFRLIDYIDQLEKIPGKAKVKAGAIEEVTSYRSSHSIGERTRTFLKVQDGCNYKCSFCTIPKARGRSRNDSIASIVEKAEVLASSGVVELVLTGVNIGDFQGVSNGIQNDFLTLLQRLDKEAGIPRIRMSSIEPNLCKDEIIHLVASSGKLMPHFHMPLQSGNNKQLRQMRRRYRRELYHDRVELIKTLMPHACIGADVIVGFPGETEEDFLETERFIREDLRISYLHVFTYSERPKTVAIEMKNPVAMSERRRRSRLLQQLSIRKRQLFYQQNIGKTYNVLLESDITSGEAFAGFTENYIKVSVGDTSLSANQIYPVVLEGLIQPDLVQASIL